MRTRIIVAIMLCLVLAACNGAAATEEPQVSPATEDPVPTVEEPTPAEAAAVETLAENLGIPEDDITIVSVEPVDWPDGCLGVVDAGLTCAEVITPGYRVVLEANDRQVEYRTNEDGTHLRAATVAMTWSREGGIAGFCDFLTVYLSGEVHSSSCKQGQYSEGRLRNMLSPEELEQLNEWLDEYGTVKIDASDPRGVADRMLVLMTLMGTGERRTVSQATERELLEFAQELHRRIYK